MRGSNLSPKASHTKKEHGHRGGRTLSRDIRAPLGDSRSKCLTEAADCAAKIASGHKLRAGRATKIVGFLNARQTQRRRAPCAWMHREHQKLFNIEHPKSRRGTQRTANCQKLRAQGTSQSRLSVSQKLQQNRKLILLLLQANRKQTANCCSTGCKIA